MTQYLFTLLEQGQQIAFDAEQDKLIMAADWPGISAADATFQESGGNLVVSALGKTITLLGTQLRELGENFYGPNITFSSWPSSVLRIGDGLSGIAGDDDAHLLVGSIGADQLIGFAGNDTLEGGAGGWDFLAGGGGNDTYVLETGAASVIEHADGGIDAVQSFSSHLLAPHVENLALMGSANLSGTGNELDNAITGNDGNNALDGGLGADTLAGAGGDDAYLVDAGDVVVEQAGAGADTVHAALTYALPAEVESLLLTGAADIDGTGNAIANLIIGNGGDNALAGAGGDDTILGAGGFDRAVFSGNAAAYRIAYGQGSTIVVTHESPALGADDGVDDLYRVEALQFADGSLSIAIDPGDIGLLVNPGTEAIGGRYPATTDIAALADGGFMVVWDYALAGDAARGLFAQRFGADGAATGAALRINGDAPGDDPLLPSVAGLAGGGFMVTWRNSFEGSDGIYARRYDAQGAPAGAEFQVNETAKHYYFNAPSAVPLSGGGYVVMWSDTWPDSLLAPTVWYGAAYARVYGADGMPLTDEFRAGAGTLDQFYPSLAATPDGGFLMTWYSGYESAPAYVQRYAADGSADGAALTFDTPIDSLDVLTNGELVAVWEISATGVYAQRFADDGSPSGDLLQVDSGAASSRLPHVRALADGGFLVTWHLHDEENGWDVHARRYASDNTPVGEEFLLNFDRPGHQQGADTALLADGSVVALWSTDADVFVRHYAADGGPFAPLTLTGDQDANAIHGGDGRQVVIGLAGNDTLDGGAGTDTLRGGGGDDTYDIDALDNIAEDATADVDTVRAGFTYTLLANFENLTLTGAAAINGTGNGANNVLTGNAGENSLSGGAGNDTLHGGAGNDTLVGGTGTDSMAGGAGDDRYVLDDAGDAVVELLGQGIDQVNVGFTYTLTPNVDNLVLTGAGAINGTGNDLDNAITGNTGNNSLTGGLGNDTLIGGAGVDTMVGGVGDDSYGIDVAGDVITEFAGQGTDTVQSSITFALTNANLEHLTLTGTGTINGTGNGSANAITGNNAPNSLTGGGGDDTLIGGAAPDTLIGSAGADSLVGGAGGDTYVVDALDTVVELESDAGLDQVNSAGSYLLPDNVDRLVLTGSAAVNGTGNALANLLTGNVAANTLDGGGGADTMKGAGGDDSYIVDDVGDRVVELADAGLDGVLSSVQFTLKANVEDLTLTGNANVNGFGNALGNVLTGNEGNNAMVGAAGDDTVDGGAGNDIVRGGPGHDILTGGAGADSFSFQEAPIPGNSDTITDFVSGVDRIRVDDAFYTAIGAPGAFAVGDARFASGSFNVGQDADDRLVYNTTTGNLYYDSDGAGGVNAILVTTLQGQPALVAQDIVVI